MTTSPREPSWVAPGPPPAGPGAPGGRPPGGTRPRPVQPAPAAPPTSGSGRPVVTIGDYTLLAKIGEGGMGIVHLARRPGGQRVALKVLRPHIVGDDEARHRLAREVASLRRVSSDKVAEVLDADPWAPVPYVATRYVPGLSLHDHVLEEGEVTGRDLWWLASSLAEGLAAVHAAGVLHRDVKPANVLMEGRTPILIDFGLARVADDPRLTHTGWLLGTPGYLAPEILYGDDATAASDVHSWAATVAWAATGRAPFGRGPSMAIMDRVRRGEHDLSGTPLGLRALLVDALDPEPERRPSLDVVRARLRDLEHGGTGAWLDRQPDHQPHHRPDHQQDAPTQHLSVVPPPPWVPAPAPAWGPEPTRQLSHLAPARPRPVEPWQPDPPRPDDHDQLWSDPWAPPVRAGAGERARRAALLLLGALDVGLAAAAFPWLTLVLLVVAVWLLRSGSLAASRVGERRRMRGRRWYDAPLLLVRAPWDLLRSVPGSTLLVLWSAGLAVSAALLCYAAATSVPVALFVIGAAMALALWTGPGGSRVRSPLGRVVRPLSRSWRPWLVAVVVTTGLGLALGVQVSGQGTTWAPADDRPLSGGLPDPFSAFR